VVFPPFVVLLGVPAAQAFRAPFMLACLFAGFSVGALNYVLARVVVGRRLRVLSARFVSTAAAIRHATFAGEWADGPPTASAIAVDSDDELGETAESFNSLLEALAHERGYRALLNNTSDLIMVADPGGTVRWATPSARSVLGYEPLDLAGRALEELLHEADLAHARSELARVGTGAARSSRSFDVRIRRRDGSWGHFETVATNLLGDPRIAGLALATRDITERVGLEGELRHQAFHDALTGLANRALFVDRLEHALARRAPRPSCLAVVFVDLDDFKTLNDSLGHGAGDELLVAVAARLRGCMRPVDTVARLGGDEFTVLLEDLDAGEEADQVAERIVEALRVPVPVAGREIVVGASAGYVLATPGDTADELVRNADLAMYAAKGLGKGRSSRYEPGMHADALTRLELKADLERALADGELSLHYQPIVSLTDGRVLAVEALARWHHRGRGPVPPAEFIPLAEESGLIVDLGRWALQESCDQVGRWRAAYPGACALGLSVNLSARQLGHEPIVDEVAAILAAAGIDPSDLILEVTESIALGGSEAPLAALHGLKALGVRIALDDFGTGYSSLGNLQRMPVDTLKLDRSFVEGLGDGDRTVLTRSVLALAETLAREVVAEGIETPEQLAALQELGCPLGQGYLLARPLPPERLEELLAEDRNGAPALRGVPGLAAPATGRRPVAGAV
jgi:diguanylate cyclase (GGDEF)-like protein/PAS domain S-box-containing protein